MRRVGKAKRAHAALRHVRATNITQKKRHLFCRVGKLHLPTGAPNPLRQQGFDDSEAWASLIMRAERTRDANRRLGKLHLPPVRQTRVGKQKDVCPPYVTSQSASARFINRTGKQRCVSPTLSSWIFSPACDPA